MTNTTASSNRLVVAPSRDGAPAPQRSTGYLSTVTPSKMSRTAWVEETSRSTFPKHFTTTPPFNSTGTSHSVVSVPTQIEKPEFLRYNGTPRCLLPLRWSRKGKPRGHQTASAVYGSSERRVSGPVSRIALQGETRSATVERLYATYGLSFFIKNL